MAQGGKGTVLTNGGEQGKTVQVIVKATGANDEPGSIVTFIKGDGLTEGKLYDLTYAQDTDGNYAYQLSGEGEFAYGNISENGFNIDVYNPAGYSVLGLGNVSDEDIYEKPVNGKVLTLGSGDPSAQAVPCAFIPQADSTVAGVWLIEG